MSSDHYRAAPDVAAVDDHRRPLRGQLQRGGPTDPRCRTGDQRNFAFQIPIDRGACHGHSSTFVLICLINREQRNPVADYSDLAGTTATSSRLLGGSLTVQSCPSIALCCSLLDLSKATVDAELGAGDEGAVVRRQEQCGRGDLFRAAHPVQWYRRGERRPDLVGFLR